MENGEDLGSNDLESEGDAKSIDLFGESDSICAFTQICSCNQLIRCLTMDQMIDH